MQKLDGLDGRVDGSVFGQQIPMGGGMGGMPMGAHGGMGGGMPMGAHGGMGGMPMGGGGMLPALQHPYTDIFLSGIMSPFYLYFSNFFLEISSTGIFFCGCAVGMPGFPELTSQRTQRTAPHTEDGAYATSHQFVSTQRGESARARLQRRTSSRVKTRAEGRNRVPILTLLGGLEVGKSLYRCLDSLSTTRNSFVPPM